MSEQGQLFAPAPKLTERQEHALTLIGEHQPMESSHLGAYLHEWRQNHGGGGHGHESRCQFCRSEGQSMGHRLRQLGQVRYSRNEGGWIIPGFRVERPSSGATSLDPANSEIPF